MHVYAYNILMVHTVESDHTFVCRVCGYELPNGEEEYWDHTVQDCMEALSKIVASDP